jgi:hypothetical protein
LRSVPGIITSILLGAWSDGAGGRCQCVFKKINKIIFIMQKSFAGRKLPLMVAFFGPCFMNVVLLVCTVIYDKTSIFTLVIIGDIIAGVTGGGMTEIVMQMSMVTDAARAKVSESRDEIF